MQVNVKEMRQRVRELLDRVEAGEEVVILRRGRAVARLVGAAPAKRLPSMAPLREKIGCKGKPLSETVVSEREEERR